MAANRGQDARATKIRNRRGFTLLELILASVMTALLAMSLYGMLHIAFKARESATRNIGPARKDQYAAELIRQDLVSILPPGGVLARDFVGFSELGLGGENDNVSFYRSRQEQVPDYQDITAPGGIFRNSVTAGAAAALPAASAGDVEYVELYCEPDGPSMNLYRRRITNLLSTTVDDSAPEVLARGVRSFALRYFDGLEWLEEWDSTVLDNSLPLAVEFVIEWVPREATVPHGRIVRQIVPLACARWDYYLEQGGGL